MRILVCLLCLLQLHSVCLGQTPKIGDQLPGFTLSELVNSTQLTFKPEEARGKILIIEFWGTWCAPCIPALMHLDSLQRKFPTDLQVIAVSDDSRERLEKFLTKKPVSIPLASDPAGKLARIFKSHIVPHSIVVNRNQQIIGSTTPDQLTEEAIRGLIEGKNMTFTQKQDSEFDPQKDYFDAEPTVQSSVEKRAYMQGLPSYSRPGKGVFKDRRITFVNVLPQVVFMTAFGFSPERTKNELPKESNTYKPENIVCLDVIVPKSKKESLSAVLKAECEKQFAIQVQVVKEKARVYVLTRVSGAEMPKPSTQKSEYSSGGSGLEATAVSVNVLRDYVESALQRPVIDETKLLDKYDFKLSVLQENRKASLIDSLKTIGFVLVEDQREVDFLVLKQK